MARSARTTKVLVVDDEESVCRSCVALLGRGGHRVTAVADALSAMREVRANHCDIALSDIRMPGISDETLSECVRQVRPDARLASRPAARSAGPTARRVGDLSRVCSPLAAEARTDAQPAFDTGGAGCRPAATPSSP